MTWNTSQRKKFSDWTIVLCLIGGAILFTSRIIKAQSAPPKSNGKASPAQASSVPDVVAEVNGEKITRDELAHVALQEHGVPVLERLINKFLIVQECKRQGISVTEEEVRKEIERLASKFNIPVDQWLKMLEEERGIDPDQYTNEIIWPMLALRKLAAERLKVTDEEIQHEYESLYGPSVQARQIVCNSLPKAKNILARVKQNPESFGEIAKAESVDTSSASLKGLIQPIFQHSSTPDIEAALFALEPGEISDIHTLGNCYVLFKCERHIPAKNIPLEQVREHLIDSIREKKLRVVADEIFEQLQKQAKVENILNDPERSQQMPEVAALINGEPIRRNKLAEVCIKRHGEKILQNYINNLILEQECRKRNIEITDADIEAEIEHMASLMMLPKEDGSPNVEGWLELVTREQGVSEEVYKRNTVWPMVALKRLTSDRVQVTKEDMQKSFEANYGPRVKCLAIVQNNLRRAQEVWEMARNNPTKEYFGKLAKEYSIESSSRSLNGEVPPIQKYGGQPTLEQEAFQLQEGELSSIIQVGKTYIILYCLGHTEPIDVEFEEVRDEIYQDVKEKKQHLAMQSLFADLINQSVIDNYLVGTAQAPQQKLKSAVQPKRAGSIHQ